MKTLQIPLPDKALIAIREFVEEKRLSSKDIADLVNRQIEIAVNSVIKDLSKI